MSTIKPLGNYVVVKQAQAEEKTVSGLVLPVSKDDKKNEGVVIAVGPGKMVGATLVPTVVKEGDKVLLKHWGGDVVKNGEEEYKVFSEDEILAIIE